MTNITNMDTTAPAAEPKVSAEDLKGAFEAGVTSRNAGLRRDPPVTPNASSDLALAWTCGWDKAEAEKAAAGDSWQDEADPRTTVG
jgi:hypothetical protein